MLKALKVWRQEWKYLLIAQVQSLLSRSTARASRRLFLPEVTSDLPPGPVLVLAPHADDETLGCGGLLALCAQAGRQVQVALVTDFSQGSPDPALNGPQHTAIRTAEAHAAARELGLPEYRQLGFPDQGVRDYREMVPALTSLLQELRPAAVLTPYPLDYHGDHVLTTRAVSDALRQTGFAGEVWLYECSGSLYPNLLVEISPVVEAKVRAIRCYASQMATNDYVESIVYGLNKYHTYGLLGGKGYAEAYFRTDSSFLARLLREIPELL